MTDLKTFSIEDMVLELKNPEQEKIVHLLENSCVSAGAGSGKTKVLATRYVYLVAKYGFLPSEILTLTFTNKAANEMYSRIYKSLVEYSEKVTEACEKKNLKTAIAKFQDSKIQTLDSYCKGLISSNIHKFGITPDFSLDKKQLEETINQKAIEFLLKHRKNPSLQFFLGTTKPEIFAKNFFSNVILEHSTISNPIDFEKGLENQIEYSKKQWKNYAKKANSLVSSISETLEDFGNNGKPSVFQGIQNFWENIDSIYCEENPENLKNNVTMEHWYKLLFEFSKLRKDYTGELCPHVEEAKELLESMMPFYNFIIYTEELKGVTKLLSLFQKEVEDTKRSMGLLTFADVASLGIECLLRFPEVREIEKKSYKAIMIDEFQDDNILQKELLFLLAEKEDCFTQGIPLAKDLNPKKLFFVGDEKQSIYKFRGADVEVFRSLSSELTGKASLSTNYRSEPALIAAFNTIFGGVKYPVASEEDILNLSSSELSQAVFKKNSKELEKYEACYNLTKAPLQKTKNADYSPCMHISLVNKGKTEILDDVEYYSEKETEALFVVKKIQELLLKYEAKDIAILFKSTGNQHIFERFLRYFGIPYSCIKQKSFFYDAPINDIISFLRVVLFHNDLLSLSIFLKSPFVRLSEDSTNLVLSILTNEKQENNFFENPFVGKNFENILSLLKEEEREKFIIAKDLIQELSEFIKNHNIAQTVTKIFTYLGYCYETMWNNSVSIYSELYDFLFAMAVTSDNREANLGDFLTELDNMEKNPKEMEDISIPLERGNAVQLMTIHASKGLEFPVVFVVGINDKTDSIKNAGSACFNKDYGVAINLPLHPMLNKKTKKSWIFELTREDETKKELAECRRVLYVAITRAEKELYLTGHITSTSYDEKEKTSIKFFDLLKPSLENFVNLEEGIAKESSPFSYTEIDLAEKSDSLKNIDSQNSWENRIKVINEKSMIYKKTPIETKVVIPNNIINPSKYNFDDDNPISKDFTQNQDYLSWQQIFTNLKTDKIINNLDINEKKDSGFSGADFGTMIHAYIEHCFNSKTDSTLASKEPKLPAVILEKLSPSQIEIVKQDAKNLAKYFINSEIGQKAYKSTWCKSEYDFKMAKEINNVINIVDGQIDLIFRDVDTGKIIVVDYKSDSNIKPEEHFSQLKLYKETASQLKNLDKSEVETYLYYIRFGKTLKIEL